MFKMIGCILLAIGIFWVGYALIMGVTVGYVDKVYNAGLMAHRQIHAIVGSSVSIIGTIFLTVSVIIEKIDFINKEKVDVLKNMNNGLADIVDLYKAK
ncbi:hypothetical protein [Entomohabitans teleogrylli]|uniref:hypothetical protein n=1 Tax=Entomohabitans teleogrylli TaxID=1384589 RepID=UPI00073D1C91|nr:hypothetical protein [Entomohabitans teleogrylli]